MSELEGEVEASEAQSAIAELVERQLTSGVRELEFFELVGDERVESPERVEIGVKGHGVPFELARNERRVPSERSEESLCMHRGVNPMYYKGLSE